MPETKEYTVYKFEELSDRAKERARDWWRGCENSDFDTEFMYDDFERVAEILGVSFKVRHIPLMNGKTRPEPTIWWSGFSSQGDGACFEGSYAYAKGSQKAIRDYAPKDERLHRIADDLAAAQRPYFFKLVATATHSGHYYHSGCMSVEVTHADDSYRGVEWEGIQQALRDFADWMYRQLEAEYEYRMSDENVDDSIEANEYTFDEDGNRED